MLEFLYTTIYGLHFPISSHSIFHIILRFKLMGFMPATLIMFLFDGGRWRTQKRPDILVIASIVCTNLFTVKFPFSRLQIEDIMTCRKLIPCASKLDCTMQQFAQFGIVKWFHQ